MGYRNNSSVSHDSRPTLFVVDVMLNACGETYETLKQYAETVDLDGVPVRTINLEGLLRTKQTMREKDVSDRIVLERALETLRERVSKPDYDDRF